MDWINVKNELPKENKRFLGFCNVDYVTREWTGIIEVWFDPSTGWKRCENPEMPVRVLFYKDIIEFPKVNNGT